MGRPIGPENLVTLANQYAAQFGTVATRLSLRLADGRKLIVPISDIEATVSDPTPVNGPPVFVPTRLQKAILSALDGKALRKEALAEACELKGAPQLYQDGGINELRNLGMVYRHRRFPARPREAPLECVIT
jgi:hypothetical protein